MIPKRPKLSSRRKRLTERQVLAVLILQGVKVPCYQCKKPIHLDDAFTVEREHKLPLALGGEDVPANMAYSHKACHAKQTQQDKSQIAKADRQRRKHEGTWREPKAKMQSRGFDKTLRKRMDGTVEKVSQ